jgi:hypothetical protein
MQAYLQERITNMPKNQEVTGKAVGGIARAESLTPEERRSIALKAAAARWDDSVPVAVCGSPDRPLRIGGEGGVELQCYVLDDGTRVLSQADFLEALGRHRKANVRKEGGEERLPAILQGKAINPFITKETLQKSKPIRFKTPSGAMASGYRAEILPEVCEIYLKARDAGVLPKNQEHVAKQAEILIRGLAHVGIIALVDEVTGYQEFRSRDALSRILEAFIAKELQPWVSTFPPEYYRELFRLRGVPYPTDSLRRPQYFGYLTNDIVYKRLAPGVLEELKRVTPRGETGKRKHRYFQKLTSNVGYPKLKEHLGAVVAFMQVSNDYPEFIQRLDKYKPRYNETLQLPLDDYKPEQDDGKGL